jgi:hypothetical protein
MNRECSRLGRLLSEGLPLLFGPQVEAEGLTSAAQNLVRMGFLECRVFAVRPVCPENTPLLTIRPGDRLELADAAEIARFTTGRIRAMPPVSLPAYSATRKAHALWGDAAKKKGNPCTFAHNFILAEVWRRLSPGDRGRWRYEVSDGEKFEKVPDAALVDGRGVPTQYHEAIGCYSASRLVDLARLVTDKGVPMLMW